MKQVYVITTERRGHTNTYTGTLDYLVDRCFGYTIECNGYSRNCKSLNTLLGRLNGGTSYWSISTYYTGRKATKEEAVEMLWESKKQIERMDVFVDTMQKLSSLEHREMLV